MYWWDYASFQFVGMFAVGLFIGWAVTEARAADARARQRPRRSRVRAGTEQQLAALAALEARQMMALRRLERLESAQRRASVIWLEPRTALLAPRADEAA